MSELDNNITSEIREICPTLLKIKENLACEIPQGYFENVEELILNQISISLIDENDNKDIPKLYFENLEAGLLPKLVQNKEKENIFYLYQNRVLKFAAVVSFVLFSIFLIKKSNTPEINNAMITGDESIQYIHDNLDDFDINLLIEQDLIDIETLENLSMIDSSVEIDENIMGESDIKF